MKSRSTIPSTIKIAGGILSMAKQNKIIPILSFILFLVPASAFHQGNKTGKPDFERYEWNEINDDAKWAPRAGLQVVELNKRFYLMGGRTPIDPAILPVPGASTIWGDVWMSRNKGRSWRQILNTETEGHWPARAYFQAVTKGKYMYVLGGQNFNIIDNPACAFLPPGVECDPAQIPSSDFFNDVWRSKDGRHWKQMTDNAGWSGRAGLSAVVFNGEIYVMGGSVNDDSSITPEGPARIYYNDVWKSRDGRHWQLLRKNAPWEPRAGAVVVVKDNYLYLIGGEDGFLCENPADPALRCPPYFNDVWRSKDGRHWQLVTPAADWAPRPGHQVVVANDQFVLFGGFGLSSDPADPFKPSNPMDIWVSKNGRQWKQVGNAPWNAADPGDIKYDFDALVVDRGWRKAVPEIYTFGGDRETFNFFDPVNYLRVDNDVWRYSMNWKQEDPAPPIACFKLSQNTPNPFKNETKISYVLPEAGFAVMRIYNAYGIFVCEPVSKYQDAGEQSVIWEGRGQNNQKMGPGMYYLKLWFGNQSKTIRIIKE